MPLQLTPQVLEQVKKNLHKLNASQKTQILELIAELESRKTVKEARTSLLSFIKHLDHTYKVGAHHRRLASLLEDLAFGRKDRIAVNIAPRFGKSLMVSIYFPAWLDRKSTRLNSSHIPLSRMPSSA